MCLGTADRALQDRGLALSLVRLLLGGQPSGGPAEPWGAVCPILGAGRHPQDAGPDVLRSEGKGAQDRPKGVSLPLPGVPALPSPRMKGPCCGAGVSSQNQAPNLQALGQHTLLPSPL